MCLKIINKLSIKIKVMNYNSYRFYRKNNTSNNLTFQQRQKLKYTQLYKNNFYKIKSYNQNQNQNQNVKSMNNRINNLSTQLTQKINSNFYEDTSITNEKDKYFSYINLKNFFLNFKTNEELIVNKYLKPKIYLEKGKREPILVLNEWGYPPFGGGENWMLDTCRVMNRKYDCYMLCFRNQSENREYNGYEIINLGYCKIILMKKEISEILKIIYDLKPKLICHQGVERIFAMKVANCTNVPFVSGFCFWNDMINFGNKSNINMVNQEQKVLDRYKVIKQNSYIYGVSEFMNNILVKNNETEIPVIESISLKENYYSPFNITEFTERKYVSILNIHHLKGGKIILNLLKKLNKKIPILLINTERLNPLLTEIENAVKERNSISNINIYHNSKVNNIKEIYAKSRIILIPSIVDETFCRVGYEAMMNGIPTLATNSGNLRYLLKDYADFLDKYNTTEWLNRIEGIYFNKKKCEQMSKRPKTIKYPEEIYQKYMDFIDGIKEPKFTLNQKRVGILVPWADQGLGIQGRELYITLKKLGFEPYIFSFKPYLSTKTNPLMQVNSDEWKYKNIYFSKNNRENITNDELIEFVFNNRISKMLIPELCYGPIFKTLSFLKLMNVKLFGLVNIETTRIDELTDHLILDKILTNNRSSYEIMKNIFDDKKVGYLGFGMNHPYFNELKLRETDPKKIKFVTFGGLNSLTRKNLDSTINVFNYLEKKTNILNWELDVYIQGNELVNKKLISSDRIKYHTGNLSYKQVIDKYLESDITIHLGDHEGLGLGFYESLNCYTPLLTLNCYPNCEIVQNNKNGWLVDCQFENFTDNNKGIVRKGKINNNIYLSKIKEILVTNLYHTLNVIKNCNKLSSKDFESRLKKFLLE
jgi:glycosyltransferase involved in cell wall biosynthesis